MYNFQSMMNEFCLYNSSRHGQKYYVVSAWIYSYLFSSLMWQMITRRKNNLGFWDRYRKIALHKHEAIFLVDGHSQKHQTAMASKCLRELVPNQDVSLARVLAIVDANFQFLLFQNTANKNLKNRCKAYQVGFLFELKAWLDHLHAST